MGYRSNIESIIPRMQQIPARIEGRVSAMVRRLIMTIDISVHDKTPVWSGLAIRNMIWTVGAPNTQEFAAIETGEVENEGRRSANAAAARRTRDTVMKFNHPYGVWYLSNASRHIFDLEAGKLPSPDRSRVPPGGMFGLTYAMVRNGKSA
jgi:hypothetical protein